MGVPGLWEILNKTGKSRSLAHLAVVDGFEANKSEKRAYRIGIDASIWYHHVKYSKGGDNPELRNLFYRLRSLAELPIMPLFILDGRKRGVKRGSKMGKSGSHGLTDDFKKLLEHFGMEWRMALGEAEAELAHLNQIGVIDAVLTDDVDAFVFGAQTVIKNASLNLTGNRSNPALDKKGKVSKHHVMVYTAKDIRDDEDVGLTQAGLILIAVLSGGDYNKGVEGLGPAIAHGLARCGFGDELVRAFQRQDEQDIRPFLVSWRARVNAELNTNSRGKLSHRYASMTLPVDCPNLKVLESYIRPIRSAGGGGGGVLRDRGPFSIPQIAALCEDKFGEWGSRSLIIKRFRDLIWEAAVIQVLRRAALDADDREKAKRGASGNEDRMIRGPLKPSRNEGVGTPASLVKRALSGSAPPSKDRDRYRDAFVNQGSSQPRQTQARPVDVVIPDPNPLIQKIVGTRRHVSTDEMLEYRVEICPIQLVALANSGIKGKRPENAAAMANDDMMDGILGGGGTPKKARKAPIPEPHSTMRMWIAASILHHVHPGLVEDYAMVEEAKKNKTPKGKGKGKERAVADDYDDDDDNDAKNFRSSSPGPIFSSPPKLKRSHTKRASQTSTVDHAQVDHINDYDIPALEDLDPFPTTPKYPGGFSFVFPNPDDDTNDPPFDEFDDDDEPQASTQDHYVYPGPEHDLQDEQPLSWSDAMFDQILDAPRTKKAPARAPTTGRKRKIPTVSAEPFNAQAGPSGAANHRPRPSATIASAARDRYEPSPYEPDPGEDSQPRTWSDALFDQILDAPITKKSRARPSAVAGNRKRKNPPVEMEAEMTGAVAGPSSAGNLRSQKRPKISHRTPPVPPLNAAHAVSNRMRDDEVLELDSDSDVDLPANPMSYGRAPRLYTSSSQDSGLTGTDDSFIDLTDY